MPDKPVLVKDEMRRKVVVVDPGTSVRAASRFMSNRNIGCLVCVSKGRPSGIITERDILNKVVAKGLDVEKTPVKDVMTGKLIKIDPDTSVQDAVDILRSRKVKRLPVIESGRLLGIVTMTDLIDTLRRIEKRESDRLRKSLKELHLTKIKLQSRIISLEDRLSSG